MNWLTRMWPWGRSPEGVPRPGPYFLSNGWLLLMQPGLMRLYHVDQVDPASRTDYTLSAKVTRLTLDTDSDLAAFGLREALALAQSERLALADRR